MPIIHSRFDYKTGKTSVVYGKSRDSDPKEDVNESDARLAHARIWTDWAKQAQDVKVTGQTAVTAPYLQKQMLEFLLDLDNPQNYSHLAEAHAQKLRAGAEQAERELLVLNGEIADLAKELIGIFMKTLVPKSREKEHELAENPIVNPSFKNNRGLPGTNRIPYGFNVFFFINLIRGIVDVNTMREMWEPTHPMVYFGYKGNSTPGTLNATSKGMSLEGVLTVPSGRTLYYEKDIKVDGDVWLQRGSTLVCKNLELENSEKYDHVWDCIMMKPCGRVLMEEGSTLICQGNLEAKGGPYRGSIVQLSAKDTIHPITCAVICKGEVKLPYGIWNAQKFGDAVTGDWKGDATNGFMNVYTSHLCPVFTRFPIIGPFHWRTPYFAAKAADFELNASIIWVTIVPIPVILLDDRESKVDNVWVDLYRWMSVVQSIYCNLSTGENFMVASDVFPHQGEAPLLFLLHKISLKTIVKGTLDLPEIPEELRNLDYKKYVQAKMDALEQELQTLKQVSPSLPKGSLLQSGPDAKMNQVRPTLDGVESRLGANAQGDPVKDAIEAVLKALFIKLVNVTGLIDAIWKELGAESDNMRQKVCREQQGVLVYGESIDIGVGETGMNRPKFATGLFVAEGDVNSNAMYTIGAMISNRGSINNAPGASTTLLSYPAFTRASLHLPSYDKAAAAQGKKLHWLERQKDLLWFGENLPAGENIDVAIPRKVRVSAEGWD